MSRPSPSARIDRLMDNASAALVETRYWVAERTAQQALEFARQAGDWERMARICLPLQEARRQRRLMALDAPGRFLVSAPEDVPQPFAPGVYLVQPPLTGMDARMLRDAAEAEEIPVAVLAREPMTRAGLWPVVAVGRAIVRARVSPPEGVTPEPGSMTRDRFDGRVDTAAFEAWFVSSCEAVGDQGVSECAQGPAMERVDALMDRLDAMPDHEKLLQALERACRSASHEGAAAPPRVGLGAELED